jgi:hypothetical protein
MGNTSPLQRVLENSVIITNLVDAPRVLQKHRINNVSAESPSFTCEHARNSNEAREHVPYVMIADLAGRYQNVPRQIADWGCEFLGLPSVLPM